MSGLAQARAVAHRLYLRGRALLPRYSKVHPEEFANCLLDNRLRLYVADLGQNCYF